MIPKIFHFVFGLKPQQEPFHLVFYLCLKSCLEVNRPQRLMFHYYHEPYGEWWERIKTEIELVKIEPVEFDALRTRYDSRQEGRYIKQHNLEYAHQADIVRLQALIEHGGVYADMDTLFVNPMPDHIYQNTFVMGDEGLAPENPVPEDYRSLCNALMLSAPGAEFPQRWLENIYAVFDGSWSRHSNQEASMLALNHPESITIIPKQHFYRFSCTPDGLRELFGELHTNLEQVYSMHLWAHLWWEPQRIDFTRFHNGLITPEFLRDYDSTYNVLARKYLDASERS